MTLGFFSHDQGSKVFGDAPIFDAKWFGRKFNSEMLKLKYRAHNAYVLQVLFVFE